MSTTALKLLALFLMFLDHIYEFVPGAPIWLTWLGRISAPLFMFCAVWGIHYTHNRKEYLKRLYLMGVIMGVGDIVCNLLFPNPVSTPVSNNIFVVIFLTGFVVTMIEAFKEKKKKQALWMLVGLVVVNALGFFIIQQGYSGGLPAWLVSIPGWETCIGAILPNVFFCEGSIIFLLFGVVLYYCKESKWKTAICFIALAGIFLGGGFSYENLFLINYEWMLIFGLPFALSYNKQKGHGYKWFFYLFYPCHIWGLFLITNLLKIGV